MGSQENPKTFYKYFGLDCRNWNTTLSAIAGRYFWLANPANYGDATDNPWSYSRASREPIFLYHNNILSFEVLREIYGEIKANEQDWCDDPIRYRFAGSWENDSWNGKTYSKYLYELQCYFVQHIGICSFSDSFSNLYLWDKYASGHRGFCLEFEFAEREGQEPIKVTEVKYEDRRPLRFKLDEVLREPCLLWDSLSVKHKKFEAEKEFRIIVSMEGDPCDQWRYNRKFREFRVTKCILGADFPVDLVPIITAVLPPHVVMVKAGLNPYSVLTGKDGELYTQGFGLGYPAGMDRKNLDFLYPHQNPQPCAGRSDHDRLDAEG